MPQKSKISASEFVVVRASDLEKLTDSVKTLVYNASNEGCETGDFMGRVDNLDEVKRALRTMSAKPVPDAIKVVHGDQMRDPNVEPILVVIPPELTEEKAVEAVNTAIKEAGLRSGNGLHSEYFEEFSAQLAHWNIAVESALPVLRANPWDMDSYEEEPDLSAPESQWVAVVWESSEEEPDELAPFGTTAPLNGGDPVCVEIKDDVFFRAFCFEMELKYPEGTKYGVPECATDDGARDYVKHSLGVLPAKNFQVYAEDTGDSSPMRFVLRMAIHKDCLREVPRENHCERNA